MAGLTELAQAPGPHVRPADRRPGRAAKVLLGQQPGGESRIGAGIDPEQAVDTQYLEDAQDGGRRDDEPEFSVTGGGRALSGQQDTDGGGVGERSGGHIGDDDGRARPEGGLQLVADVLGIADVDLSRKRDDSGRRQPAVSPRASSSTGLASRGVWTRTSQLS